MRIVVSGTHGMGKSTLIQDFIKVHPQYQYEIEPYHQLQNDDSERFAAEPCLESFQEQLDFSIGQLNKHAKEPNIIFDRCPVDFIAYAMHELEKDSIDINDSEIFEKFLEVKEALDTLDFIVFLPITREHLVEYTEEDAAYRKEVDAFFKKIYHDDICDIFPEYNHPQIIEIWGERLTRVKKLESFICS